MRVAPIDLLFREQLVRRAIHEQSTSLHENALEMVGKC